MYNNNKKKKKNDNMFIYIYTVGSIVISIVFQACQYGVIYLYGCLQG